jgi:hypothetical protein
MLQALARQKAAGNKPKTKPKDSTGITDTATIEQTQAAYPQYWRPQQGLDLNNEKLIDGYIATVFGADKIKTLQQKNLALNAPNYYKRFTALPQDRAAYTLDDWIVKALSTGKLGIGQLKQALTTTEEGLNLAKGLTANQVSILVDNYANELNSANEKTFKAKVDLVTGDKYYKNNLPHPNFKYGTITDLAAGTIQHPDITTGEKIMGPRFPGVTPSGYIAPVYQAAVANDMAELEAKKLSPYVDEVRFRASVKTGKPSTAFLPKEATTPTTITPNQIVANQPKADISKTKPFAWPLGERGLVGRLPGVKGK